LRDRQALLLTGLLIRGIDEPKAGYTAGLQSSGIARQCELISDLFVTTRDREVCEHAVFILVFQFP
jgi:hypothetical protein